MPLASMAVTLDLILTLGVAMMALVLVKDMSILVICFQKLAQQADQDLLVLSQSHQSDSCILLVSLGIAAKVVVVRKVLGQVTNEHRFWK